MTIVPIVRKIARIDPRIYKIGKNALHNYKFYADKAATRVRPCSARFIRSSESGRRGYPSQYGQEAILLEHRLIPERAGFFVDLGANDPKVGSNSWYLESEAGYNGIAVDALPLEREWARERPGTPFIRACIGGDVPSVVKFAIVRGSEGWESKLSGDASLIQTAGKHVQFDIVEMETTPINDLLTSAPSEIDVMFLDLEGAEYAALASLDLRRHKPKVVCVENSGGYSERWRLRDLMRNKGYEFWGRIWIADDVFVTR